MRKFLVLLALGAVLAAGCEEAGEPDESDGGTDADTDTDGDTDSDQGTCGPPWGWYDETSGLCWQDPAHGEPLSWDAAIEYCDALALGGHGDWRLPSISELRTFVRGCEATMPDGECGVTDECETGCLTPACEGCAGCEGPGLEPCGDGPAGRYFDPGVAGGDIYQEKNALWSSTPMNSGDLYVWTLGTGSAAIGETEKVIEDQFDTTLAVMCVRDGQ